MAWHIAMVMNPKNKKFWKEMDPLLTVILPFPQDL